MSRIRSGSDGGLLLWPVDRARYCRFHSVGLLANQSSLDSGKGRVSSEYEIVGGASVVIEASASRR